MRQHGKSEHLLWLVQLAALSALIYAVERTDYYKGQAIDLTIQKGEIMLLKGSSGSGKTSLLRALAGLLPHCGAKIVNQTSVPVGLIKAWIPGSSSNWQAPLRSWRNAHRL